MLFWLVLLVQLFLRNQVEEISKQGIQAASSTPIHHVKWWIGHFSGIYRALAASEAGFFLILLKGLQPLYICLCILLLAIIILVVVIIVLSILLLLLISFLLFQLLLEFLSRAVYCSYEVSWPFGFVSFNFFIYLNLIHATTIWCWRTTSILSFDII